MKVFLFLFALFFCFNAKAYMMDIPLEPMQDFSGLSKSAILDLRKDAVDSSPVFSNFGSYKPNDSVYQIKDGAPWISAYELSCFGVDDTLDISLGESRESLGVLNPELLFYVDILNYVFYKTKGCSTVDYLTPYKAGYDEDENTISAYIDYSSFYQKNKFFYFHSIKDANARDLGYNYAFAYDVSNINFKTNHNLSTAIFNTRGFYHLGGSCKKAGGCNNYSPYRNEYVFSLKNIPAYIKIKLWKNKPASMDEKADIIYELMFN